MIDLNKPNIKLADQADVDDCLNDLIQECMTLDVRNYFSWPQWATLDGQRTTDVTSNVVVSIVMGIVLVCRDQVPYDVIEQTFGPLELNNNDLKKVTVESNNRYFLAIAGTEKVKKFCHKISVDLIDNLIGEAGFEPKVVNYNLLVDYDATLSVDEYFNVELMSFDWFADQTTHNWIWMDTELTINQLNKITEVANNWLLLNHTGWRVDHPEQRDGELFWTVIDL